MDYQEIIPGVILISFFAYAFFRIGKAIWSNCNHARMEGNCILSPDAKVIGMHSEKVQYLKNGMKYKTTVRFSDGFVFITHTYKKQQNTLDTGYRNFLCRHIHVL